MSKARWNHIRVEKRWRKKKRNRKESRHTQSHTLSRSISDIGRRRGERERKSRRNKTNGVQCEQRKVEYENRSFSVIVRWVRQLYDCWHLMVGKEADDESSRAIDIDGRRTGGAGERETGEGEEGGIIWNRRKSAWHATFYSVSLFSVSKFAKSPLSSFFSSIVSRIV